MRRKGERASCLYCSGPEDGCRCPATSASLVRVEPSPNPVYQNEAREKARTEESGVGHVHEIHVLKDAQPSIVMQVEWYLYSR